MRRGWRRKHVPVSRRLCVEDGRCGVGSQLSREKEQYYMKRMKIAFGLVVVAGLMAFTSVPAMATPMWTVCRSHTGGKWGTKGCTKAESSGSFETAELTETVEVTSSAPGGLELTDTKATGGETSINCVGTGLGTVKNVSGIGKGLVTRATATGCKFVEKRHGACEESGTVLARALNLPWETTLKEESGEMRAVIESDGNGEPGYAVECTVAAIFKVTDECTGSTSAGMKEGSTRVEGAVESEFEAKTAAIKCSIGGAGAGRVRGRTVFSLRIGNTLIGYFWLR